MKESEQRKQCSLIFKMRSSLNAVGVFWAFLSFIAMGLSCVGFFMPWWLEGQMWSKTPVSVGLFRRCNYPKLSEDGNVIVINECGRYTTFADIPSLWWQVCTIIVGVGAGLTIVVAFTAIPACCLEDVLTGTSSKIAGVLQLFAGLLLGAGCVMYPIGWDSTEVHQICGPGSDIYKLGTCTIGWAYYVTMAGAGTSLLCTCLSCNAAKDRKHRFAS